MSSNTRCPIFIGTDLSKHDLHVKTTEHTFIEPKLILNYLNNFYFYFIFYVVFYCVSNIYYLFLNSEVIENLDFQFVFFSSPSLIFFFFFFFFNT